MDVMWIGIILFVGFLISFIIKRGDIFQHTSLTNIDVGDQRYHLFNIRQNIQGVNYERWGDLIYDPDVESINYQKRRENDPTLPIYDPRDSKDNRLGYHELAPYMKWLFFSDERGSYKNRWEFFNSDHDSPERKELEKRLNPYRLVNTHGTFISVSKFRNTSIGQGRNIGDGKLYLVKVGNFHNRQIIEQTIVLLFLGFVFFLLFLLHYTHDYDTD